MTRAKHACADHIHKLRGRTVGDTMPCTCGRQYTLRQITFAIAVMSWWRPVVECIDNPDLVWVRDREAERAYRREQTLRKREWRRS